MFSRFLILATLAMVAFQGCSPNAGAPDAGGAAESKLVEPVAPAPELDIGDVEADLSLVATVQEEARTPGIQVEEMRTMIKELSSVKVVADPAQVTTLPIYFRVRHTKFYEKNAVSVSIRILRDNQVIANHGGVVAGMSSGGSVELTVDALEGLSPLPDTILLHGEMDMHLLDESGAAVSEMSTEVSNPVRIEFSPKPSETAAPVIAPDVSTESANTPAAEAAAP